MTAISAAATCAIVIATRCRPDEIKTLLGNLRTQSRPPDAVVIVDASPSPDPVAGPKNEKLNLTYIHHPMPSAAVQRNIGIGAVPEGMDFIGILDDDVALQPDALKNMMAFWETAPPDIAGCGFNWINFHPPPAKSLKESFLSRKLGLYSDRRGRVMSSGWQTLIGTVEKDLQVDWLPIGASFWRKTIFERFEFDPFFDGYSYLEDLDFTYSVSRKFKLAVVQKAGFFHHHSETGRINLYHFGKIEVRNRLYFVRKHGLSMNRCYLGIFIRLLLTLYTFITRREKNALLRATGNLAALTGSVMKNKPPAANNTASIEASTHAG